MYKAIINRYKYQKKNIAFAIFILALKWLTVWEKYFMISVFLFLSDKVESSF